MSNTTLDLTTCDASSNSTDDFEILTIYPRESGPLEIGCLIRSKADALHLHKVIRGHLEVTRGVGDAECSELGEIINDRWDSSDFSRSDVEKITNLVQKLNSLYEDEHDPVADGPEYGVVQAILHALQFAAELLGERNASITEEQSNPDCDGQSKQLADAYNDGGEPSSLVQTTDN